MAYTEYVFSKQASSAYGTATKELTEDIVATVPGLSISTINSDTEAAYSADIAISGCSNVAIRIYNSSTSIFIRVGANLDGSANVSYYTQSQTVNTGFTTRFCLSAGMTFIRHGGVLVIGRLAATLDDSEIEIFGSGSAGNLRQGTGNKTYSTMTVVAPSISTQQAATLPANTIFLGEGIVAPDNAYAVSGPYLLNGHGPYGLRASATMPAGVIISNGREYFYLSAATLAWRI